MLSESLKRERMKKGLSKSQLARISTVSRNTINLIENQNYKNTKFSTIEKLANALDVPVSNLVK